jgi:hypothetical protein
VNDAQVVKAATVDGIPMLLVYFDDANGYVSSYVYARNHPPQSATVTLRLVLDVAASWIVIPVLLSDSRDAEPLGVISGVQATGATSLTTGTLTGESEGLLVDFVTVYQDHSASLAPNGAQTQLQMDNATTEVTGGASYRVAASGTMNWSWSGSDQARLVGVPVFSQMAEVRVPVSRELK